MVQQRAVDGAGDRNGATSNGYGGQGGGHEARVRWRAEARCGYCSEGNGETPNSQRCARQHEQRVEASPTTMTITSLYGRAGAPGIGRGGRRLTEMRSATAQAEELPNSNVGERSVGEEVRHRPELGCEQHRVLRDRLDPARHVGGDQRAGTPEASAAAPGGEGGRRRVQHDRVLARERRSRRSEARSRSPRRPSRCPSTVPRRAARSGARATAARRSRRCGCRERAPAR